MGRGWALAADAATYCLAAGFLLLVRIPFGERPERQDSVLGPVIAVENIGSQGWGIARSATAVSTAALEAAFLFAGVGLAVLNLAWSLTVQEKVPEEMPSRIMAIDGFFSFVAMPIGQLLVGPLILLFSIRTVELGSDVLAVLVTVYALSTPAIANLR